MSVEIITKFLTITDDMDLHTKISVDIANNSVKVMAKDLEDSKMKSKDGRKMIITLTADLEQDVIKKIEYVLP